MVKEFGDIGKVSGELGLDVFVRAIENCFVERDEFGGNPTRICGPCAFGIRGVDHGLNGSSSSVENVGQGVIDRLLPPVDGPPSF